VAVSARLVGLGATVALLGGCGALDRLEQYRARRVDEVPVRVERGDGWRLSVPEGARVTASASGIEVDAADGLWWFDVQLLRPATPTAPLIDASRWADEHCTPARWDLPATPAPGTWTAGGFCTVQDRDHWLIVAVEDRPDGARLLTALVADRRQVPYEDAWVLFVRSALSLSTTDEPASWLGPEAVRERLRTAQQRASATTTGAELPRPGGGRFSRIVSEVLADEVWRPRTARPLPTTLAAADP
jgi:hypothetical protein